MLPLLALLISSAQASEIQVAPRYAVEKSAFDDGIGRGERSYGIEVLYPLRHSLLKAELGGWIAKRIGYESSVYLHTAWGFRAGGPGFFAETYVGPALISRKDSQLGSHLQIAHDFGFGWIDVKGYGVGLSWKHISNAGIWMPNRGRDYIGARFLIPIGDDNE